VAGIANASVALKPQFSEADFLLSKLTPIFLPIHLVLTLWLVGLHACGDLTDLILEYVMKKYPLWFVPVVLTNDGYEQRITPRWYQSLSIPNDISAFQNWRMKCPVASKHEDHKPDMHIIRVNSHPQKSKTQI
jgi:hypothetical protein